jgi:hypothetical protein
MQDAVYSPGAREAPPLMATRTKKKPAEPDMRNFRTQLERESPESTGLPERTFYRWRGGSFPAWVRWLAERPDIARAIVEDAEAFEASRR